jgi:hypothetical protein
MAPERTSLLLLVLLVAAAVHRSDCQASASGDPEDHAALAKVSRAPKSHRRETIAATGSDTHDMPSLKKLGDAHWKDRLCLGMFHAFTNRLLVT